MSDDSKHWRSSTCSTIVLVEALAIAEKGKVKFDFKKMYEENFYKPF